MYHATVKRIAVQNFLRVNRKDYAAILKSCSPDVHHRFGGHHALGGERHDREALGRWFERLGRLAPTLQLTVHDVWGKVFDIDANEDSQLVAASLQVWAAHGVNEALADPILS
jgi:ketosteroid isomerase-like protein